MSNIFPDFPNLRLQKFTPTMACHKYGRCQIDQHSAFLNWPGRLWLLTPPLPAITFIPSEGSNTATKLNFQISNFSPLQSKALFTFDFIPLVRVLHKNPFQAIFWNRAPTNSKRYHGPVDFLKAKLQKNEENTWSIFMQMGKRGNVSKQGCGGKATQNMSEFWPFSCLSEPSVWFSLQSSRLYLHTNNNIDKKWHSLDAPLICKYRRK